MNRKTDIYADVTNKIVAMLESGTKPWTRPWDAEHAMGPITMPLRHTSEPYTGINVLNLWIAASEHGFNAPMWLTFNQTKKLGAHVRKGEKGTRVVYASTFNKTEHNDETGKDERRAIPFLKHYTVFNIDQIDGLPANYYETKKKPTLSLCDRVTKFDTFFNRTRADIRYGGNHAFYSPSDDFVQMPHFETFHDMESFYSTLAHEMTHWTRHGTRLDRDFGRKRWGDEGYAMEELVAEIGSAFLCAELGVTLETREDHASYIDSWIQVLKNDNRAIFTAASHAQKATTFLNDLQQDMTAIAA